MNGKTLVHPYNGTPLSNQSINQSGTNYGHFQQESERYYAAAERNQFQKVTYFHVTFWKSKSKTITTVLLLVMENRPDCQKLLVGIGFDYKGTTPRFWG